ncbi:MAG: GNAT family N-acetyltransferase [Ewingella sp.]|jgi:N-acetylglutamate synthase-like GNAT family acetyltransferase|uniref:GNAT family N-acetyltransferase n=1 Tax=Ewingella TaxID=41201 RepID=UPI0017B8206B|nr:GNAT family N-acetyltransferase [Pseudomonas reactans]
MAAESKVKIARFARGDTPAVVALILPIQNQEFGVAITAEQQPDLSDVPGFYQQGHGDFWVAKVEDEVVGCISLKDIGEQQAALRKMFVAKPWRGSEYGVAGRLLETLLDHARAQKLQDIYLGTTEKFLAAHRFYEKKGFVEVDASALPATFPRMSVDVKFYHFSI